jgi:hypothetical protein
MKPVPSPALASCVSRRNLRRMERYLVKIFKEMSGAPKSRSDVQQGRTWDHLRGASPRVTEFAVVVVGVTPHQGVRESRNQGEGEQVIGHIKTGRYA